MLADLTAGWVVSSEVGHRLPEAALYDEIVRVSGEDIRNTFFIDHEIRFLAAYMRWVNARRLFSASIRTSC